MVTLARVPSCAELWVAMSGNPRHRGQPGAFAAQRGLAALVILVVALALASCGSSAPTSQSSSHTSPSSSAAPTSSQTSRSSSETQPPSQTPPAVKDTGQAGNFRMAEVGLTVPAANRSGPFTSAHRLSLPQGWTAEVWALVDAVRFETWTPENDLPASQPANGPGTLL